MGQGRPINLPKSNIKSIVSGKQLIRMSDREKKASTTDAFA